MSAYTTLNRCTGFSSTLPSMHTINVSQPWTTYSGVYIFTGPPAPPSPVHISCKTRSLLWCCAKWQGHQTSKPHMVFSVTPDVTMASHHTQYAVVSFKVLPIFSWTPQTVPVTILSTVRDLERLGMSKVDFSLSPRLFLLIPSPITPLLLLPTRKI